jgi:capsular exopolysaccharide synthesis family protein
MDYPNAQPGAGSRGLGVKMYRYKSLLKRYWWVLALTASVGLAYQGWVVYSKPIQHESSAKLSVREELNIMADGKKFGGISPETFVATSLAMMKSEEVGARVQRRLALEAPELAGERVDLSSAVLPRSYIFTITARSKNPAVVEKFSDLAREEFVALRDEQRSRAVGDASGSFGEQITKTEAELKLAQAKRDKFVSENKMEMWMEQKTQAAQYLSQLLTEQGNLQTQLQRLENLTPEQSLHLPQGTGARGAGSLDAPLGQDLYSIYITRTQELASLQAKIRERGTVWKPKHPRMKQLLEQEAEIKDALRLLMEQHTENVSQQVRSLKKALEVVKASIAEQNKKIAEAGAKDTEFQTLETAVKQKDASLGQLREQAQALTPAVAKGDIFVKLGSPSPVYEVQKDLLKHLLIGLCGGLVVGAAFLVFRDKSDDRLSSSSDMMEQFNEPILGQIPDVMASRDGNLLPLLQPEDDRYAFAEAFRSLRSSLIFMPNQQQLQTVLVTSAIPNEGKSTITANLGITMDAAGANIVLVDADLRRGDLASLFDMDGRTGLSNVLRGEVSWRDAVQETRYSGLTLLPRGPVTNQSSELLLLPSLEKLLEELKAEFDLVLFNTAPILATDDTSSLAPHFDGTLMVIRAQFTSARLTHNALGALYQRQVNVLGLILNCVDTQMPDYYYYQYPKYYAAQ